MKKMLAIAATLALGISGCAEYQYSASDISSLIYGPSQASEVDVNKMSELAWVKYQTGTPISRACSDARTQLNIKSRSEFLDTSACERIVKPKAREQSLENERIARQAYEQKKAEDFVNRVAMIRSGDAQIQTPEEAAAIYGASDGQRLASRPLVRPDNKKYVISGFIDAAGGLQPSHFLLRSDEHAEPRYASVYLQQGVDLPQLAQAESRLFIVGSYVGNKPYNTTFGEQRSMPVFQAEFVKVLN